MTVPLAAFCGRFGCPAAESGFPASNGKVASIDRTARSGWGAFHGSPVQPPRRAHRSPALLCRPAKLLDYAATRHFSNPCGSNVCPERRTRTGAPSSEAAPGPQENSTKAKPCLIRDPGVGVRPTQHPGCQPAGPHHSFHHGETTSTGVLFWRFVKFLTRSVSKSPSSATSATSTTATTVTSYYKGTAARDQSPHRLSTTAEHSLEWVLRGGQRTGVPPVLRRRRPGGGQARRSGQRHERQE